MLTNVKGNENKFLKLIIMKQRIRYFCLTLLVMVAGLTSAEDVIEISTVEQLKVFRDAVNGGNQYADKTVKLTADLDLSGETNWTPIGNLVSYPGQSFNGTFDGQNHTISNLTVNDNTPNYAVAGLFGSVVNGTIKNLTVKNVNLTSTHYAGGIVAYTSNGPTIENCHVIGGTIKSTPELLNGSYDNGDKVGGIMGYATAGSTIDKCWVEGVTITAYRDFGGIIGCSAGTVSNNTVKNITLSQDLTHNYKGTAPTTFGDIIGRNEGATLSNNKVIKSIVKVTDNEGKEAEYGDMKDAFDAINANPKESYTITLLKDATYTDAEQYRHAALAEGNTVTKNVIIDGAGHTLTFVGGGVRGFYTESTAAKKVTFQNMTIADNTRYDYEDGNNAWEFAYLEMGETNTCPLEFTNVKFADGISVDGTKTTFTDCEFIADGNAKRSTQTAENCMWISNGDVIVNNCTFTGYRAIKLHEKYGTEIGSVVIDGCMFKDLSVKPAVVIGDLNAATSVTITNNTIEGVQKGDQKMYLYESDTDLAKFTNNLSGNTFNAKDETELTVALNSGMFNKAVLQGDIALTENVTCGLEEGTFTLVQGEKTLTSEGHAIALNPGVTIVTDKQTDIFSAAANFKVVETAVEGGYTYTVVAKEYVAKIGEEQYYSLAEAFEAATNGQTITVLTDIDLPSTIAVTKQVTLDLAGKTISNTSDLWVGGNWSFFSVQANGNLTVTGDGTIDAKENDCYTFDVRNGGILTIKNGIFTGNISCVYLINEVGTGVSTCNIEGGRFSIKQLANNVQDDKYRYLLNCHDASYASNTVKFNVTGGSFVNFNPANNLAEGVATNFCAAGYEAVQDGNVWTVQKAPVAKIDDKMYYSLADAFAAATDVATITLLKDVELADRLFVNAGATPAYAGTNNRYATTTENKSITLDLNGNNVTSSSNIALAGGSLNIVNNGTADEAHGVISTSDNGLAPIEIRGTGDLTSKRALTIGENVTLKGSGYGLNIFGSNDAQKNDIEVNVNGKVEGTLFVLGNLKNTDNNVVVNVNGSVTEATGAGVSLNGFATVNVAEKAVVEGNKLGIEVRAGNLNVAGGTITAKAEEYTVSSNGSGAAATGAAISVAQHTTGLPINANVSGCTLSGVKTISVADPENKNLEGVTVKVADALANAETVVIPEGYKWVSVDGISTLTKKEYVAQIGEGENIVKYESLAEAVAAATDGATITLLKDVELADRLFVNAGATPEYNGTDKRFATTSENKSITLDLNGYNVTTTSNIALAGGSLNIVNNGTADADHGVISTSNNGLAPIEIRGTGDLTQKRTLTVGKNVILKGADYGLNIFGSNNEQKNIIEVNVNGKVEGTLFVLGNLKNTP